MSSMKEDLNEQIATLLKRIVDIDEDVELLIQTHPCSPNNSNNVSTSTSKLRRFLQINSLKEDIGAILGKMKEHLHFYSVSQIFRDLPLTGQLLGRLCGLPELLKDKTIYESLMECILKLYRRGSPGTPLEVKAKSWAISQLHSTVNVTANGMDTAPLCVMGANQSDLYQQHIRKMVEDTARCLRKRSSGFTCPSYLSNFPESSTPENISQNTDVFLRLLDDPEYCDLAVAVFEQIVAHANGVSASTLFRRLTEHQNNARNGQKPCLPYPVQTLLWLNYLPSLEKEVLGFVRNSVVKNEFWVAHIESRLQTSFLPKACAEHSSIYQAVISILEKILQQTAGDWRLVEFIGVYHRSVRQCRAKTPLQAPCFPLSQFYPPEQQQLIHLLQVSPTGLTTAGILNQVSSISNYLNTVHCDECVLWKTLIQFPEWYNACLQHCLTTSTKQVQCCVEVMLWYRCPHTVRKSPQIKASLVQTISMFQGLMGKTHLKVQDVDYTISASQSSQTSDVIWPLISQILIIFLILSKSGLSIGQYILSKASKTDNNRVHLRYIADILRVLGESQGLDQQLPSQRRTGLRDFIVTLRDKLPDGGEQFLAGGEQFPAGGEQFPAGGEQFPARGEQFPAGEEEFPVSLEISDVNQSGKKATSIKHFNEQNN